MKIVSYFTPNYRDIAFRYLVPSCKRWTLPVEVYELDDEGGWQANTRMKSAFCERMRLHNTGPIVWLDADAEVVQRPIAFDLLEGYDVAFHRLSGRELLSGTLWIGDTDRARELCKRWVAACEKHPETWDQVCLDMAVGQVPGLRVHDLPPAYCFIFDTSRRLHPDVEPVIVHHQASRQMRGAK